MKYFYVAILAGFLAGCAHISEYNQGCRDGVTIIGLENATKEKIDNYCNILDATHSSKE